MGQDLVVIGPEGWDRRFLELAAHIAQWSKDPSTKVGCVIVGPDREIRSTGFNGFPRGVRDTRERLEDRTQKYPLVCHGEENAILNAARIGVSLKGCKAYMTWPSCTRCSVSLIQVGIAEVIYPAGIEIPERWADDFTLSDEVFKEAGVLVRTKYGYNYEVCLLCGSLFKDHSEVLGECTHEFQFGGKFIPFDPPKYAKDEYEARAVWCSDEAGNQRKKRNIKVGDY